MEAGGSTALMWAVRRRWIDVVTMLVARGAKVETQDIDGRIYGVEGQGDGEGFFSLGRVSLGFI